MLANGVAAVLFLGAMLSKESGAFALAIALFAVEAWREPNESAQGRTPNGSTLRSPAVVWQRWRRVVIAGLALADEERAARDLGVQVLGRL